ncbi:MAG: hypothetical protein HY717_08370 [Planctomycetes bacterium]|nr:hypothetical protein [Planctomycetota bacterium]
MESDNSAQRGEGRFWNEVYWFGLIALGAWIVAGWALPPRLVDTLNLLNQERKLAREIRELARQKEVIEQAIESMENDPIYQDGVYRNRLRVKRPSEEYIEPAPPLFR